MRNEARNAATTSAAGSARVAPIDNGSRLFRPGALQAARLIAILGRVSALAGTVEGAPYTIARLYSNQTGDLQYIELRET